MLSKYISATDELVVLEIVHLGSALPIILHLSYTNIAHVIGGNTFPSLINRAVFQVGLFDILWLDLYILLKQPPVEEVTPVPLSQILSPSTLTISTDLKSPNLP